MSPDGLGVWSPLVPITVQVTKAVLFRLMEVPSLMNAAPIDFQCCMRKSSYSSKFEGTGFKN